jgi:hypothetical protein
VLKVEAPMMRRLRIASLAACILSTFIIAAPVAAYDPTSAANYAEQWWDGYNDAQWPRFDNDCTNFVSQAMWAGGYNFNYSSGNPWYAYQKYGGWYYSQSWSFVHRNRGFTTTSGDPIVTNITGKKTSPTNGVKGDIVYYSWFGDREFDDGNAHATFAVVTSARATSTPDVGLLVDGHSNRRHKEYWTLYKWNVYWPSTIIQVVHPLASR